MKTTKKLLALIFAVVLSFSMLPTTNINAASKVKLSKTKTTIYVGKTVTLKLKNNKKKVKWTTSNKKIATVSKKGKVKGKKAGKVTITAKVRKKKYKCKITVKKKQTPKPTIKPTEQPTTKPAETPTTQPTENPTETETTLPSGDDTEEPSLNPQINENVETLKTINEIQQEQGTVDENTSKKINAINESKANFIKNIIPSFDIQNAIQGIINDTAQYNKYIKYHGGLYDKKYYDDVEDDPYSGVKEYNDTIVNYLYSGVNFEPLFEDTSCDDYGNIYLYTMFHNLSYKNEFEKYQYKKVLRNYMNIGYPKFDSIDTFILETEPQKYYDKDTGRNVSSGINFDDQYCSYVITFLSNERIYNAYMSATEVEDNGGNLYCKYRLLDLTVVPITKNYMDSLDINWDLVPNKWFTITEPCAGIGKIESNVQIKDYKIEKAAKEGYNQLSFTYVLKRQWTPTSDEITEILASTEYQKTGKILGGYYFNLVDYNTGIGIGHNDLDITRVDGEKWELSDYEQFENNDTGSRIGFYKTATMKYILVYPQDYTEICIGVGGDNQLLETKIDEDYWNDGLKIQFGETSYYKNGKNNSHWMRIIPK